MDQVPPFYDAGFRLYLNTPQSYLLLLFERYYYEICYALATTKKEGLFKSFFLNIRLLYQQ